MALDDYSQAILLAATTVHENGVNAGLDYVAMTAEDQAVADGLIVQGLAMLHPPWQSARPILVPTPTGREAAKLATMEHGSSGKVQSDR